MTHDLDIWHTFEKQGGKVMHTIRTRNSSIAKACMAASQLLEALLATIAANNGMKATAKDALESADYIKAFLDGKNDDQ